MRIFIFHGTFGSPGENWFPWLSEKLSEQDHEMIVPKFPTPDGQTLENWMRVIRPYLGLIDRKTILIGHSLGATFLLSLLERLNTKIRASFLVAGFTGLLGNDDLDQLNKSISVRLFNWNKIKKNCERFYIFSSTNDPYVPLEKGIELSQNLDSDLIRFNKAGHFNSRSGYSQFPELVQYLEDILE
jgi:hypothetical protein